MAFFPSDQSAVEYGEHASLLLALTEELGLPIWSVRTVPGGFEAHDAVVSQLLAPEVPAIPEITAPAVEEKTPPAWWGEPEPTVDVLFAEDGKVFLTDEAFLRELDELQTVANAVVTGTVTLTGVDPELVALVTGEPDRETVRAWAKQNGHQVADKGQLKKAIYDAYAAAQAE